MALTNVRKVHRLAEIYLPLAQLSKSIRVRRLTLSCTRCNTADGRAICHKSLDIRTRETIAEHSVVIVAANGPRACNDAVSTSPTKKLLPETAWESATALMDAAAAHTVACIPFRVTDLFA